jgi:hypothetical protein
MTLEERINVDNYILNIDGFSQFRIYQYTNQNSYFLWGDHKTNSGNVYTIWGPLPNNYPIGRPPIYVYKPNPLVGYDWTKTINSYGTSHSMHTLWNGPNGEVQICHWRDTMWHSGITLNKVMLKVVIWLEAYEQYLSSGKSIAEFVGTMQE